MINREQVEMDLKDLEQIETAKGWDLPCRFLVVRGPETEPVITTVEINPEEFPHPGMYLDSLKTQKVTFPQSVVGVGLIWEGYAHLPFEQAVKTEGHVLYEMWEQAMKDKHELKDEPLPDGVKDIDEALMIALGDVWEKYQMAFRPAMMPDHLRIETRGLNIIFRSKEQIDVLRKRDGDLTVRWDDSFEGRPQGAVQELLLDLMGIAHG